MIVALILSFNVNLFKEERESADAQRVFYRLKIPHLLLIGGRNSTDGLGCDPSLDHCDESLTPPVTSTQQETV